MTAFYIVKGNRITRSGECQPEDLALQAGEGEAVHEGESPQGESPDPAFYFDVALAQWVDPRALQDFKATQWTQIKQARAQAEYAGFTWDGSTFDSDATSQNRITGAVTLAQMSAAFSIDWTLADNTVRTLNQGEMLQVGAALGAHVAAQFSYAQSLRTAIEAATTREQVEAVVW